MINQFRGEFSFLSNFYSLEKPLEYGLLRFNTVEHFYQAMKFKDFSTRQAVMQYPNLNLKSFVRTLPIRPDWESIKLTVMEYGLEYKFSNHNPTLREKLIATGEEEIQEGNWWGDKYWGVCLKTGEGENHLGKLLMKIRDAIRRQEDI